MIVLGIDTATWTASVGLCADARVLAERSLPTEGKHGFSLLPLVEETLRAAGLEVADVGGVAVSIGPGSFTGLRVALATAKGLALARGIPIAAVRTLPALARAAGVEEGFVCPLLDARKGEVYAALVEMRDGKAEVRHHEVTVPLVQWLPIVGERDCAFIGDAVDLVRPHARPGWTLLPFERFHPRGGVVARLGELRLAEGDGDDLASLEPLYVRPSEAELRHLGRASERSA